MTEIRALVRNAKEGKRLIVTGPHYQWLEMLETEQTPSPRAVLHAIKAYLRLYKHPRKGRFSASAMGGCARAIVFGYAGAPQVAPEPSGQEIFDHGSVAHLKWQMEGLTVGWMKDAEVWTADPDLLVGGSIDGILEDDSIFELKSAASSVYRRVTHDEGPKLENVYQGNTYMFLRDVNWLSLVYEDRSYGKFHEFRMARSAKIEAEVLRRLRSYKRYVEEDDLPPMLADCEIKWGPVYKQCFFRQVCPTVSTLTEAERAGTPEEDSGLPFTDMPEWLRKVLPILEEASVADG